MVPTDILIEVHSSSINEVTWFSFQIYVYRDIHKFIQSFLFTRFACAGHCSLLENLGGEGCVTERCALKCNHLMLQFLFELCPNIDQNISNDN